MPFRIGSMRTDPHKGDSVRIVPATVESIRIEASGIAKTAAGGFLFSMPLERYLVSGFDPRICGRGAILEEETIRKLTECQTGYDCYRQAKSLACRAEQSGAVMSIKLSIRGFIKKDIAEAIENLVREGLIDDSRFASAWIASRLSSSAEGPTSLLVGLLKKGISRIDAQEAIATAFANGMRNDILIKASIRFRKRGIVGAALFSRLRKLGFDRQEILESGDFQGDGLNPGMDVADE